MTFSTSITSRTGCITALAMALTAVIATPLSATAQLLPVGDGRVAHHPETGNVYACTTSFRVGGAAHVGEWFNGDTWDPVKKPHVQGRMMWSEAEFTMQVVGDDRTIESNGLPVGVPTGNFPISRADPAFAYDRNPNAIEAQQLSFEIPMDPVRADEPGCLPMGMIGITTTGVAIYNALDAAGLDAAAHEVQDLCDGHPQGAGQYHYHSASPCLPGVGSDDLVGWALDGYPILGMGGGDGSLLTNEDLDACHGRSESITVDGRAYDYAYRLTPEYPYTMGCFMGEVPLGTMRGVRSGMRGRNRTR